MIIELESKIVYKVFEKWMVNDENLLQSVRW